MSLRVRVLAGLVVALAVIRAVLFVTEAQGPVDRSLLRFDSAKVARIVLSQGSERLVIEEDSLKDGRWRVASRGDLPVLEGAPQQLIARLRDWRSERTVGSASDRYADWGVSDALGRRVRLEDRDGAVLADVLVGRITGIDRDLARESGFNVDSSKLGLYVREAGQAEVVVVNDFASETLGPNARAWFLRPLVRGEATTVVRVSLSRKDEAFTLRLKPDPAAFVGDARPPDPPKVFGFLQGLFRLEILGPAEGATPPDATRLRVDLNDGSSQALTLWEGEDKRWFVEAGALRAEVPAHIAQGVAATRANDLAQRKLVRYGYQDLRRLYWITDDDEISLRRHHEDRRWYASRTGPNRALVGRQHSRDAVDPLAKLVTALEVTRWDAGAADSFASPYARVILFDRRGDRLELTLGELRGGERALKLSSVPVPGWIPAEFAERLGNAFKALAD
jgi:hypothetical protein